MTFDSANLSKDLKSLDINTYAFSLKQDADYLLYYTIIAGLNAVFWTTFCCIKVSWYSNISLIHIVALRFMYCKKEKTREPRYYIFACVMHIYIGSSLAE